MKPFTPSELLNAVLMALGQSIEPVTPFVTAARDASAKRLHVLVAEDNPVNQKVIRAMLARLGYEVELVSDGDAAVKAALSETYAAIFMDCQMPETDGFEATIRLRQQLPTHVPIIALTASVLDADRKRCREVGMDDFLAKPIERNELAAVLARWLPASADTHAESA